MTPVLAFFNNKGGVGKTTLVYHLSIMLSELGKRVIVVDLDPQANLTASFLNESSINIIWSGAGSGTTIYKCVEPLMGVGDILPVIPIDLRQNLRLIPGDIDLSRYEEVLAVENGRMPEAGMSAYRTMRILSSFWQVAQSAASEFCADIVLIDIGPNLGAINRSALIASDFVVMPISADMFSLRGLMNLGPTLSQWRMSWKNRLAKFSSMGEYAMPLPIGNMVPIGYLMQQFGIWGGHPTKAFQSWINKVPAVYQAYVVNNNPMAILPADLGFFKDYHSLIPKGQSLHKPIFELSGADGLIGTHLAMVSDARGAVENLARTIASRVGI